MGRLLIILLLCNTLIAYSQLGETKGTPWTGSMGITESVQTIKARQAAYNLANPFVIYRDYEKKHQEVERDRLKKNPLAPAVAAYSKDGLLPQHSTRALTAAQTIGINFTSTTLASTGSFPPDNMGAVGPTQYITSVNGRLISFNKTTGVADGVLNVAQDVFFASVMTPVSGSVVFSFTSDPRVRYDRKSQKWIFIIIDVPCANANCTATAANRVLFAVSNSPTITNTTTFTYFFFQQDIVTPAGNTGEFLDYPTLGIDNNALYIGGNMFSSAGAFTGTSGFVVRKSSILGAGPIVVSAFRGLAGASTAGPFTPQGVDNLDDVSTDGYFIGVDNATFSTLMIRRVTNPGGTPSISANIALTVPSTTSPKTVPHQGNTGGTNGNLDALDDRLYAAVMRNGRLWTAHSFRVSTAGVANTAASSRNGVRWYELSNLGTTPTVFQSGTIFDPTATNPVYYNIPSVMVSGQGHAVVAMTSAGAANRINTSTTGRLANDPVGTMGAIVNPTASSTSYNPASDPGGGSGRRWGDYSFVSLDPIDDQTMWMIHQFCDSNNSYGCRVTQLNAPPPATPTTCNPSTIALGLASVLVEVTGTVVSGSGFYDPGTNLTGAIPFSHIGASVSGGVTVNSITYTDPTHITLNLNTTAATLGTSTISITNPDGQNIVSSPILTIACPARVYVDASKTAGTNNGTSWANAYTSLSTALNNHCVSTPEIWVAKGTYKPAGPSGDRALKFNIPVNVKLIGGFDGTEVNLIDRKFDLIHTTNKTTLSGDLNGNDVNFTNNGENSYTVVSLDGSTTTNLLDGFSIIGGNNNNGLQSGGGLFLNNCNGKVENCIITYNFAGSKGGGLYNQNGSPIFANCRWLNNSADSGAGAYHYIAIGASKTVDMSNCIFVANMTTSSTGSILYNMTENTLSNLTVSLTNCSFTNNSSPSGAGVYNFAKTAGNILDVQLKNCAFFGNGGANTFVNEMTAAGTATINSNFSLYDNTVTGYVGMNNVLTTTFPFNTVNDLHLPCESAALDVGTNTSVPATDIEKNSRPSGPGVDIGAYELQETSTWLGLTTDWNDSANWSGKQVPNACIKVIINNGVPFMPLVTGVDNACYSLTANSGANVNINDGAKLTIMH